MTAQSPPPQQEPIMPGSFPSFPQDHVMASNQHQYQQSNYQIPPPHQHPPSHQQASSQQVPYYNGDVHVIPPPMQQLHPGGGALQSTAGEHLQNQHQADTPPGIGQPLPPQAYSQAQTPRMQGQPLPPLTRPQQWPPPEQQPQYGQSHLYQRQGVDWQPPIPPPPPPSRPPYHHPHHEVRKPPHSRPVKQQYQEPRESRDRSENPNIQVITLGQHPDDSSSSRMADQMQAMMMQQMMMQQMQSHQMQAAQMAAMTQQTIQNMQNMQKNANGGGSGASDSRQSRKPRGYVNVQTVQKRRKSPVIAPQPPIIAPRVPAAVAPPPAHPPVVDSTETLALDNWQEATIILCFAAVGLIYLICSRASGEGGKEKKPDPATRHMS